MSRTVLAAGCLVGAALLTATSGVGRRPRHRLRNLSSAPPAPGRPAAGGPAEPAADGDGVPRPGRRPDALRLAAGLGGLAVAVVVGGWPGLLAALPTAMLLDRALRRIEPPAVRNRPA